MNDGEERSGQADADGQGGNRDRAESPLTAQQAQTVMEILQVGVKR